jgi:hypothetical protein
MTYHISINQKPVQKQSITIFNSISSIEPTVSSQQSTPVDNNEENTFIYTD